MVTPMTHPRNRLPARLLAAVAAAGLVVAAPPWPSSGASTPDAEDHGDTAGLGSVTVHVAPVEGATRSVSISNAEGRRAGGPATVDGPANVHTAIHFVDLPAGTYDVFAEQIHDGGGSFLTRTPVEVSGDRVTVRCTGDDLGCAVS
jgi:hypothetical protein